MYDRAVTQRFLKAQQAMTPSFKAVYYSQADINAMTTLLEDAWEPGKEIGQGRQVRDLSPEEVGFIENERLLCTHDFHHYCGYFRIIDFETRELVPLTFNFAQNIALDVWAEMEANRWAIMVMQLKARRLGVSTLSASAVAHRLQFHQATAALIASSSPAKSDSLATMIRDAWDHMPWWLMPQTTAVIGGMPVDFRELNSTLSIQAGNQFTGIGRGASPSVVWLSEVCEWRDPRTDIDSSLIRAILPTPKIFFILESTALGRGNWYHNRWKSSKEALGVTASEFYPMFLPWYTGRDIYPTETWLRKNPVPVNWIPDETLLTYAKRCEAFVQSHPRLKKFLGEHWVLPKEQLWWYYATREEYRQNDQLNLFLAEVCSDDVDAFQSTSRSAFRQDIIQMYLNRSKAPLGVYRLRGVGASAEDVPELLRPTSQQIDTNKPVVDVPCNWGSYSGHFQLVPIKFGGYSASRMDGNIFVWEWPRENHQYCFGVDCAEGIGADRTVIQMVRKDTLTDPDEQVAEWASAWIGQMQVWPVAMTLGTLYSPRRQGEVQQALSAVEVSTQGDAVQWQLRLRGWVNHLIWPRALDNRKVDMGKMTKIGFVTNRWSRPYVIGLLLQYINSQWITINSPYFVEEMEAFAKEEEGAKIQAEHGEHDDRIMALGFALFALHVLERKSGRVTTAEQRVARQAEPDPTYETTPNWQQRAPVDAWAANTFQEFQDEALRRYGPRGRR